MILECNNITLQYPGSNKFVFNDMSFRIDEPGFHALFGPSGVGKTSLARVITGDITEYTGHVQTSGMDTLLYSYNMERLPGWSSVGSHLDKITPASLQPRKDELIHAFGLEAVVGQRFSQLSLGQQNRINLVRYLLQDFHLLIMDESLANVDELTREKILLKIKAMFPDLCFLYISHNVIEVAKYCRQILVFRGAHKKPQSVMVTGQDYSKENGLDKKALEITMLEIMNAS